MDIDPDKLTPAQLDRIAEHLIEKALGTSDPQIIADTKRKLEAGETLDIEAEPAQKSSE